jgi:hypothetical protein
MKRNLFVIGLIALSVPCTFLTRPAHAESSAKHMSELMYCIDSNGYIIGLTITCVSGSGTCVPVTCES